MASGKWIKDISSRTATIDAARRVLGLRLEALRDAVGGVFQDRDDNFEDVHQLRVAARRASAAVEIFEPCLGKKAFRSASKRLRHLRRAAGEARDVDVFLMHCTRRLEAAGTEEGPSLDLMCGYAIAERIPAQVRMDETCAGYPFEFERWMSETIAAVDAPPRKIGCMHALGRQYLGGLCDRVRRSIGVSTPSFEELHSLRIVAKRLRYAMEVFAGCFAAPFREELYPRVVALQEILGIVSDADAGLARTERLMCGLTSLLPARGARWNKSLETFVEDLKQKRLQGCEQFEAWKARVNRTGFETMFRSLLAGATADEKARPYPFVKAS